MDAWRLGWQVRRPLAGFARPRVAARCEVGPGYHLQGRQRSEQDLAVLQVTLSGTGLFVDRHGEHRVPAGWAFLCRVADPEVRYLHPGGDAPPWQFVFFSFHGALDAVAAIVARDGPVFPLTSTHPAVQRILSWRHRTGEHIVQSGAAAAIVAQVLADLADRPSADRRAPARLVLRAEELIARSSARAGCAAGRLAAELGTSREYLSRAFVAERGYGVREAVARSRVQQACRLLQSRDAAMQDIAREVGFASPARFAIVFRRLLGMPPSRWRAADAMPMP
jgi:AraC-like DNA-binding protein